MQGCWKEICLASNSVFWSLQTMHDWTDHAGGAFGQLLCLQSSLGAFGVKCYGLHRIRVWDQQAVWGVEIAEPW